MLTSAVPVHSATAAPDQQTSAAALVEASSQPARRAGAALIVRIGPRLGSRLPPPGVVADAYVLPEQSAASPAQFEAKSTGVEVRLASLTPPDLLTSAVWPALLRSTHSQRGPPGLPAARVQLRICWAKVIPGRRGQTSACPSTRVTFDCAPCTPMSSTVPRFRARVRGRDDVAFFIQRPRGEAKNPFGQIDGHPLSAHVTNVDELVQRHSRHRTNPEIGRVEEYQFGSGVDASFDDLVAKDVFAGA